MKELIYFILAIVLMALFAPAVVVWVKHSAREIAWNSHATADPAARMLAYNVALAESAGLATPPEADGRFVGGSRITGFNASLFDQSNFSEELTGYAVGYKDPEDPAETLEFLAPELPSPRKPEYETWDSPEEFLSQGPDDDLRGIGANFPTVTRKSDKETKKLQNRGLAIELDEDEIEGMPDWQNYYTAYLIRMLNRNSLRRAVTLASAAAVNTNVTWSTAAGKDPDKDVESELILSADVSGIRPNNVLYGDSSWDIRRASHRAQNNAGGYASAKMTPEEVRAYLMVDGVHVSKARFASSPGAASLSQIVSNKVIMFYGQSVASKEDPSNLKRFTGRVSARHGGGKVAVHLRQVGDKGWRLAVEKYELLVVTSTLGIRQFTVAAS